MLIDNKSDVVVVRNVSLALIDWLLVDAWEKKFACSVCELVPHIRNHCRLLGAQINAASLIISLSSEQTSNQVFGKAAQI